MSPHARVVSALTLALAITFFLGYLLNASLTWLLVAYTIYVVALFGSSPRPPSPPVDDEGIHVRSLKVEFMHGDLTIAELESELTQAIEHDDLERTGRRRMCDCRGIVGDCGYCDGACGRSIEIKGEWR